MDNSDNDQADRATHSVAQHEASMDIPHVNDTIGISQSPPRTAISRKTQDVAPRSPKRQQHSSSQEAKSSNAKLDPNYRGSNRKLVEESLHNSLSAFDTDDMLLVSPLRRTKSLETPTLDQHFSKPTNIRRTKSSSGSSVRSGESTISSRKRLRRKLRESSSSQREKNASDTLSVGSSSVTSESANSRSSRKSRSSRDGASKHGSSSSRRGKASSGHADNDDDASRASTSSRRSRASRGSSRESSEAGSSEGVEVNESDRKSRNSTHSSTKSRNSPSSSSGKRREHRSRGDKAPVTPHRDPPSPPVSTGQADPIMVHPEKEATNISIGGALDSSLADDTSSKSKKKSKGLEMRKGSKYPSDDKSNTMSKPFDMKGPSTELEEATNESSRAPAVSSSESREPLSTPFSSHPAPILTRSSLPRRSESLTAAWDSSKKGSKPRERNNELVFKGKKGKEVKRLKFPSLPRTFSLGTRKKVPSHISDDITIRSSADRTVSTASTMSTTQSDLSEEDYMARSSSSSSSSTKKVLSTVKTFSRLLSRLRTDFDNEVAEEELAEDASRLDGTHLLLDHLAAKDAETATEALEENRDVQSQSHTVAYPRYVPKPAPTRGALKQSNSGKAKSNKGRIVGFGMVAVREYERAVGDNPAVSSGTPISLGWCYNDSLEVDVDKFESNVRKPGPRTRKDFFLTPHQRFHILLDEWQFSLQEICHAKDIASEVRNLRQISILGPPPPPKSASVSSSTPPSPGQPIVKKAPRTAFSPQKGGKKLPKKPKPDNRWDPSCPAAQEVEVQQ